MSFVNDIISSVWLFQTESVVPLFQELSIWILILFGAHLIIATLTAFALKNNNHRIVIGAALFPVSLVAIYGLLYYFGNLFAFNFQSINISDIINFSIQNWWFFLIFWPIVLLKIPLDFVGRKGEGGGNILVKTVFAPIYEEFAFRLLAINTIFLITNSIEISVFLSAIAFSFIHLPNMDQGKWVGPSNLWLNFTFGIVTGIVAINYGIIFAILYHSISNLIARLIGDYL